MKREIPQGLLGRQEVPKLQVAEAGDALHGAVSPHTLPQASAGPQSQIRCWAGQSCSWSEFYSH